MVSFDENVYNEKHQNKSQLLSLNFARAHFTAEAEDHVKVKHIDVMQTRKQFSKCFDQ